MDMQSLKVLELLLIVGVVGYFFLRQRRSADQAKQERSTESEERTDDAKGSGSTD